MRRDWFLIVTCGACVALAACQQQPKAQKPGAAAADVDAAAEAQAHVDSLRQALAQHPPTADDAGPRIAWIDPSKAAKTDTVMGLRKVDAAAPEAPSKKPAASSGAAKPTPTQAYGILLEHVQHNAHLTPLGKATAAVTLTSALPGERFDDAAALAPLRSYERDAIERYRHVIAALHAKVAAGSELDRQTVLGELEAMFEHAPIRMRGVKLCQRVRGFGSYDEADAAALLAGREHRMIVYVELEDYRAMPGVGPDGQYEVKLSQEIELFNEADGLAVWRVDPVQIVDHCRNKRRDFFVVQLIKLPPRLNVGKYLLKIRVTDQHGGSVDERTVPIAVVADAAMVGK